MRPPIESPDCTHATSALVAQEQRQAALTQYRKSVCAASLCERCRYGRFQREETEVCLQSQTTKMHNENFAYKGLLICMVLFCAYMQWSPVVDFDYIWINGHEHCVGAANAHQMDSMVTLALPQPIGAFLDDSASQLLTLPVTQSAERMAPPTTLRL